MAQQQSGSAAFISFRRRPRLIAAVLGGLAAAVVGVSGPAAAQQQGCNAPLGWWESKGLDPFFLNPNGPSPTTACDFELWSWSAFVHWMQRDPKTGLPLFLLLPTFNDLKPDGTATLQAAASLVHQRPLVLLPRNAQPQSLGSFQQAGPGGVLVDQAGHAVYYTTHMDPIYFAFTQRYFGPNNYQKASPTLDYPIGATVMKSSWRIVRPGEDTSKLYTTTAIVPKLVNAGDGKLKTSDQTETVTVALIGVHMVGVIKDHPEFVWATFQLPDSAPALPAGMDPHSPNPVSMQDFPLYKAGTAADQCNYLPNKMSIDEATQVITPVTNVFLQFPDGGATPPATAAALASSNTNFQSAIPEHKDKLDPAFANFQLSGSTWLLANTLKPGDGDMDKEAIGSIDLANATMETFVGEWNGRPRRTVLICARMRSGSTLLGEAIYFAGGLGCPLEYFHSGFRPEFERRWLTSDIHAYAKAVHRFRTDPSGVFSAKLFWQDLVDLVSELALSEFAALESVNASRTDPSVYRRLLSLVSDLFPNPSFIFLTRRDVVRQAVSTFIAVENRAWRRFSTHINARRAVYSFDGIVQRLAKIQNDNQHWLNFFRANALQYYAVSYEALASHYEPTLRGVLAELDRPDAPIAPPRLHQQADAYSEELLQRFLIEFRQRARGR